jgi:hypothetical protein
LTVEIEARDCSYHSIENWPRDRVNTPTVSEVLYVSLSVDLSVGQSDGQPISNGPMDNFTDTLTDTATNSGHINGLSDELSVGQTVRVNAPFVYAYLQCGASRAHFYGTVVVN